MAMTEKQIKRRMTELWELHYIQHETEAEWYGTDDNHVWVCDIPSKQITVKMVLNEKVRRITIYEAPLEKQSRYDYVRETEWTVRARYTW
jgi:hypothetical protein